MKNWKKWLVAGCMAALLGIGTMGTTAMAMGGGGVDRSEAVAEEEKVPSGKATQNSRVSSKAWKKINGVCYNGNRAKRQCDHGAGAGKYRRARRPRRTSGTERKILSALSWNV